VLCPACHEENPDKNRFCGQCGTPLRGSASGAGPSSFPLQDVIEQPPRGSNGDAGLPGPDPRESLSKGGQRDLRPWTVEPLPKEVIDYDNGLPLLAEPGMDRRRQTPESVRQAMQKVWGNAASTNEPEAPAQPEPEADLSRYLDFTPAHHRESSSLSGPSFLGLSGDAESPESEENPKARKWPRYVAAAVVSAFIAALIVAAVMHWPAVSAAASRYARVGASYVQLLRTGKADSSTKNTEPPSASAGPVASNEKAAPDFVVEQHPAQPATAQTPSGPSEGPTTAEKTTAEPVAPGSPATTAGSATLNSTTNVEATGQTQAVEPKPSATGRPRPAAEPSKAATLKPSARQSSKPAAGQGEYQQALATTNPEVARALLWRATALGNSDAQVRLADMYIYGQGVPQNCDQGLILLRSAAQKANAQAQGKLGALYATGKCVSQDRVQAYRWLTLAINDGQQSEWTEKNREMVWRQMSPQERSRAATAAR